jgi:hypothetical protein
MCVGNDQQLFNRLNMAIDRRLDAIHTQKPISRKQYLHWKKLLRNLERKRRNCLSQMGLVGEIKQQKETGIYWD